MKRREFELALLSVLGWSAAPAVAGQESLRINGSRLNAHLRALGEYGKNPQGGVTRIAYTEADRQGRAYVMGLMRAARLDVRIDAAGNLVGRRGGRDLRLPPIVMGSHIDSVPEGGNYDGDVGSLGAIEVAQTLAEAQLSTGHPLEVIVFQNEEGGLVGSRAIGGGLTDAELDLQSRSGKTVREGIAFIGGDPARLATARRQRGDIAAYLELHVEQGGVLEAAQVDIGVVEGIVGNTRWDVTVEGFANHAGSTPMDRRQDALLAAARFVEAVNRVVTSQPGLQVGTVGRIQALPGAYNVIPGRVVMGLDLRDLDAARIASLYREIHAEALRIAGSSGTTFAFQELSVNPPSPTHGPLRQIIDDSARQLGLTTRLLPSGATHDAQEMARLGPIGMIFIPSAGGISHSPREFTPPQDVTNGANVLLRTLLALDARDGS